MIEVILVITTAVVLVLSSIQDLRERMIYVVPIIAIHGVWSIYLLISYPQETPFLILFWILQLGIYLASNHWKIWGGGDSDVFMLLGNACVFANQTIDGYGIAILECICLAVGLVVSIFIARVERRIRSNGSQMEESIAVVPGIALVILGLLIQGIYWRMRG